MDEICKQLDKLDIRHSKVLKCTRTLVTYETSIQSKGQLKKFLDIAKWKGYTPKTQAHIDTIRQYIDSPLT